MERVYGMDIMMSSSGIVDVLALLMLEPELAEEGDIPLLCWECDGDGADGGSAID